MNKRILVNLGVVLVLMIVCVTTVIAISRPNKVEEPVVVIPVEDNVDEVVVAEEPTVPEEPVIEVVEEPVFLNELTGLPIDEADLYDRPFAVTISNIEYAMPQFGISQADILYETLAEGGIPRMLAVFKDFECDKIGPIRSARHYLLDLAWDSNAIFVHYGKSPQAAAAFYNLGAEHLDGLSALDLIMCYQDPNRTRPHSTFTSTELLHAGLDYQGYSDQISVDAPQKFIFSTEPVVLMGDAATKVDLPYSWFDPWFEYDEDTNLYNRFQYGDEQIDANTGEQLTFTNIIVQSVDMWPIAGDTEKRIDMQLFGSGAGYYITGGKVVPITWIREGHDTPTYYYNEDGSSLIISPGKTFISIFPSYNFNYITFE